MYILTVRENAVYNNINKNSGSTTVFIRASNGFDRGHEAGEASRRMMR